MLDAAENPRAVIGANQPPETAIERAKPIAEELGCFLSENPVLTTEDEVRAAKALLDRFVLALRSMEDERDAKVRPLREKVNATNSEYFRFHNPDKKRPALWDKLAAQLWGRMNAYALELERQRQEGAKAAREAAEEQALRAKELEQREIEAATEAASGVCDVDIARVTEEADQAFTRYRQLDWKADRAEASAGKVRITGGALNAVSLKDHETLHVTDWKAAIEEMSGDDGNIPQDIADAILKCARAYRKETKQLPGGVIATFDRGL
jgi:hypothetical protein